MDHQRNASGIAAKDHVDHFGIANIGIHMVIARAEFVAQAFALPPSRGFFAKELAAQIVVDADDLKPLLSEIAAGFRADQSSGTSDDCDRHGKTKGSGVKGQDAETGDRATG